METNELRRKIEELAKLRRVLDTMSDYDFGCLLGAYNLLINVYCPFHKGDRVRLKETPIIDEKNAPGWLSSKHFLVEGAVGVVENMIVNENGFRFDVIFDDESWVDGDGTKHAPSYRHTFCFKECMLEKVGVLNG